MGEAGEPAAGTLHKGFHLLPQKGFQQQPGMHRCFFTLILVPWQVSARLLGVSEKMCGGGWGPGLTDMRKQTYGTFF